MNINRMDLLAKGWKPSEIEQASKILANAEGDKHPKSKHIDKILILFLVALMLINCFICAVVLVPFIYAIQTQFILVIAALVGFIFSILFTLVIYDVERIHYRNETGLFITFIMTGFVNAYLIILFSERFGVGSKLSLNHNVYIIAAIYLMAFLMPNIVYQMRKKRDI